MTETLVECYSGYQYGERPRALIWQGERLPVESVLKRWRIPSASCFLVRTKGDLVFELRYQESTDQWQVESRSESSLVDSRRP